MAELIQRLNSVMHPKEFVAYWENENQHQDSPYLGLTLFNTRRTNQLTVEQIKGKRGVPVVIQPSAYDARPTLREKIGIQSTSHQMPFFREASKMSEKERQELLTIMTSTLDQGVTSMLPYIYDMVTPIIDGAEAQKERMIMQILSRGKISVQTDSDKGDQMSLDYNYDFDNTWNTENITTLTGTERWTMENKATSKPLTVLMELVDEIRAKGIIPSKVILTRATMNAILASDEVHKDMLAGTTLGVMPIANRASKKAYIEGALELTFIEYDKVFKDTESSDMEKFYPDGQITIIPDGTLGDLFIGRTPDEFDGFLGIDGGYAVASTGVTVSSKYEKNPYNVETAVSMVALPSPYNLDEIFIVKNAE